MVKHLTQPFLNLRDAGAALNNVLLLCQTGFPPFSSLVIQLLLLSETLLVSRISKKIDPNVYYFIEPSNSTGPLSQSHWIFFFIVPL